jgi:hypothetical protein
MMGKRDRLHGIDEVRLNEIYTILDKIRRGYIDEEIENDLDKLEDAITEFENKWRKSEE